MKIDAITCCSGDGYALRLAKALPIWLDTLDSITVVCKSTDDKVLDLTGPSNLKFVTTDVFDKYGAYFNKGASLCYAYATSNPTDWVLHFDSDIVPPSNWRELMKIDCGHWTGNRIQIIKGPQELSTKCLYGAHRSSEIKSPGIGASRGTPIGFFQLWHSSNPIVWKWPLFDPFYSHCACYDMNFLEMWNKEQHRIFSFSVLHLGGYRNWFGEGNPLPVAKLAHNLHLQRVERQQEMGRHIDHPYPQHIFELPVKEYTHEEAEQILQVARERGPFDVLINFKETSNPKLTLTQVKEAINARQTN